MRIDIEPASFVNSSQRMASANETMFSSFRDLIGSLQGCGEMAGTDVIGLEWAHQYDSAVRDIVQAGEKSGEGMGNVATLLSASVVNYVQAENSSTIGSGFLPDPPVPAVTSLCLAIPPSAAGSTDGLPWFVEKIKEYVEVLWPDADTGKVRQAATAWAAASSALTWVPSDCRSASGAMSSIDAPEVPTAMGACTELAEIAAELRTALQGMSDACTDYANEVDHRREEMKSAIIDFIWQSAAIEAGGALLGAVTVGIGEGAAQAAEAARIAAFVKRLAEIVEVLRVAVAAVKLRVLEIAGKAALLITRAGRFASAAVEKVLAKLPFLKKSPWTLDPSARGFAIEKLLGGNLPNTFKTFDKWDKATRTATSVKSLDLGAATYANRPSAIYSRLKKYIDEVKAFSRETKQGTTLTSRDISSRVLELAIPKGGGTPAQMAEIQRAISYAKNLGIDVKVIRVP